MNLENIIQYKYILHTAMWLLMFLIGHLDWLNCSDRWTDEGREKWGRLCGRADWTQLSEKDPQDDRETLQKVETWEEDTY